MSFAAITLYVASQRVFVVVYFVTTQSGNFWIHPPMSSFIRGLSLADVSYGPIPPSLHLVGHFGERCESDRESD
jgi:hypothetical protein